MELASWNQVKLLQAVCKIHLGLTKIFKVSEFYLYLKMRINKCVESSDILNVFFINHSFSLKHNLWLKMLY